MLRNAFRGKPIGSLRPRFSGIKADENKVRFAPRVLSIGIEMHLAASRLTTVAAAVPFGVAVVLLWVKYERCVNESVGGGVFR